MSRRQDIITALDTRLKGILKTEGYQTDMGKNVREWYAFPVNEAPDTDSLLYEDPSCARVEPYEYDDNVQSYHYKRLTVHIYIVTSGSTAPAALRVRIADVLKAIGTDVTWGGLALDTELEGDDSEVVHEKKKIGGTRITISIDYKVERWDD